MLFSERLRTSFYYLVYLILSSLKSILRLMDLLARFPSENLSLEMKHRSLQIYFHFSITINPRRNSIRTISNTLQGSI